MNELIIKKNDLLFNIEQIKKQITKPNYTIIAVVKGNGYGIGLVPFTNFLIENGFNFFAVANTEEALALRSAGITSKILLLTPCIDMQDVETLIENDIILTIDSFESAQIANEVSKLKNKKIIAHIKIDTRFIKIWFSIF